MDTSIAGILSFIVFDGGHRTDALNMAFDKAIANNITAHSWFFAFMDVIDRARPDRDYISSPELVKMGASP